MQVIIEKILNHNIKDSSEYADEKEALKRFLKKEAQEKSALKGFVK